MSPTLCLTQLPNACFPRVSGDEPRRVYHFNYYTGFSPRERG